MSKVFVVQDSKGKNIASASDFGEMVMCVPDERIQVSKENVSIHIEKLYSMLRNFEPNIDFILPLGDPAFIGIVFAIVSEVTAGKFNILKWDRQEKRYLSVPVNLYEE